jgi:hypothetical protein
VPGAPAAPHAFEALSRSPSPVDATTGRGGPEGEAGRRAPEGRAMWARAALALLAALAISRG